MSPGFKRVLDRIAALVTDPRGPGWEKLSRLQHYRVRQGRYRILYSIQDTGLTIRVINLAQCKDVNWTV